MINNKMNIAPKVRLSNLMLLHGLLAIFALLQCERTPTKPVPEIPFSGRALLENQTWHDGITIIRSLITDSLLVRIDTTSTDSSGKYVFSKTNSPVDYLVTSYYPYFTRDTVRVKVSDKGLEAPIPDMQLLQRLRITVKTDKTTYSLNDTIYTIVMVKNIGETPFRAPSFDRGFDSVFMPNNGSRVFYYWDPDIDQHYNWECLMANNQVYQPGDSMFIRLSSKIVVGFTNYQDVPITPGKYLHFVRVKCWSNELALRLVEPVLITVIE